MSKLAIVLFGMLAIQGGVWAETWEDRAARKAPWDAEFPDDPACWNPAVRWNTGNPWVVGRGSHFLYDEFADCFKKCAKYNTCYRAKWETDDAAATTCTSSSTESLRDINMKIYRAYEAMVLGRPKTARCL
jgi:hypothetical protein